MGGKNEAAKKPAGGKAKDKPTEKGKKGKKCGKGHSGGGLRAELASLGLRVKDIGADGNCLFRSLGDQLQSDESLHERLRQQVLNFIEEEREQFEPFVEDDEPFNKYCSRLKKDGVWAGYLELNAASQVLRRDIVVYQPEQPRWTIRCSDTTGQPPSGPPLHIAYTDGCHYDSVRMADDFVTVGKPPKSVVLGDGKISEADLAAKRMEGEERVMSDTGCTDRAQARRALTQCNGDVDDAIELVIEQLANQPESEGEGRDPGGAAGSHADADAADACSATFADRSSTAAALADALASDRTTEPPTHDADACRVDGFPMPASGLRVGSATNVSHAAAGSTAATEAAGRTNAANVARGTTAAEAAAEDVGDPCQMAAALSGGDATASGRQGTVGTSTVNTTDRLSGSPSSSSSFPAQASAPPDDCSSATGQRGRDGALTSAGLETVEALCAVSTAGSHASKLEALASGPAQAHSMPDREPLDGKGTCPRGGNVPPSTAARSPCHAARGEGMAVVFLPTDPQLATSDTTTACHSGGQYADSPATQTVAPPTVPPPTPHSTFSGTAVHTAGVATASAAKDSAAAVAQAATAGGAGVQAAAPGSTETGRKKQQPVVRASGAKVAFNSSTTKKPSRNKPCTCGSGRKYKDCCGAAVAAAQRRAQAVEGAAGGGGGDVVARAGSSGSVAAQAANLYI